MRLRLRDNAQLVCQTASCARQRKSALVARPFGVHRRQASRSNASNRGALLISLVLYGTIYDDMTTTDIDLTGVAAGLGLDEADIAFATDLADQVLVPAPSALMPLVLGGAIATRRRR